MSRRQIIFGVLALAAAVGAAGCSASPDTPRPSASGTPTPNPSAAFSAQPLPTTSPAPYPVALPDAGDVNRLDPSATAQAAVVTLWSTDMATDPSQYEADLRAGWLLSPGYLTAIEKYPPVGAPGAWWDECAQHQAYTTVSVSADYDDQPSDTPTSAERQFSIVVTPHGAGGWSGPTQAGTVFLTLTRPAPGQDWAVSGVEYTD